MTIWSFQFGISKENHTKRPTQIAQFKYAKRFLISPGQESALPFVWKGVSPLYFLSTSVENIQPPSSHQVIFHSGHPSFKAMSGQLISSYISLRTEGASNNYLPLLWRA